MAKRSFAIPATLQKSAETWQVGGVASSFHRDLDGEAITPEAVKNAIPGFMAARGASGIAGGPIRLHHDFWERFLKRSIGALQIPPEQQYELIAAISLPLGRVTQMWVDKAGKTHWRGILSNANPIARIVWNLLREKLISLGVSLGGKIFSTQTGGRDALGRPCTLITEIRIDELSVTDNPALRLVENEDTGAYIQALSKSIQAAMAHPVHDFLTKAIGGNPIAEANSGDWGNTKTNQSRSIGEPKTLKPRSGTGKIQMDGTPTTTGMGNSIPAPAKPQGNSTINTVDTTVTVSQLVRDLGKCADCKKRSSWQSPQALKKFSDATYELASVTNEPPPALINLVRLLQSICHFAQALPHMSDYQANGTVAAMAGDLTKALEDFEQKMPAELMGKPVRPPGSPGVETPQIMFPTQYVSQLN